MALTLSIPRDIDLAAAPLPEADIIFCTDSHGVFDATSGESSFPVLLVTGRASSSMSVVS